jgi:hypothetical protein
VNKDFHAKLKALDLESITKRLLHPENSLGWDNKQVSRAIYRYKIFLYLIYLYPNHAIIPTREIDIVWHYHILDTQKYASDCEFLFGYFLHHNPNCDSESKAGKLALSKAFAETMALFIEYFGISLTEENDNNQGTCLILTNNLQRASACVDPRGKGKLLK